jgi:Amt family ammonium transporter
MKSLILLFTAGLMAASLGLAQAPAGSPPPAAPLTTDDVKNVEAPKAEARLKGDPDGALTGTVSDVAVADSKKGLTIADLANQAGQNKIAINFMWTLITGFLVMFMQAGFAIVETGLCRAKNANHTMMMNFMVYGVGMLAYYLIGFTIQMGGVGGVANLGGAPPLNQEYSITMFGKSLGLFGQHGIFLMQGGTYDVGVMVVFLFQMVFMDTALTIVTGSAAERWKYVAFMVSSFFLGAFIYPLYGNLGLGRWVAIQFGN